MFLNLIFEPVSNVEFIAVGLCCVFMRIITDWSRLTVSIKLREMSMQDTIHVTTVDSQQPASSLPPGINTTILNDRWLFCLLSPCNFFAAFVGS